MGKRTAGGLLSTSTVLDEEMKQDLERVASERGISRAAVMRDWLKRGREAYREEQEFLSTRGKESAAGNAA